MKKVSVLIIACLLITLSTEATDHLPYLAEGVIDTTQHETLGLKEEGNIRRVIVFSATDDTDHYANGVAMTAFKGALYCMWQSSPKDEDSDDTWVAYSRSTDDGLTWSKPQPLALPSDNDYCTSTLGRKDSRHAKVELATSRVQTDRTGVPCSQS